MIFHENINLSLLNLDLKKYIPPSVEEWSNNEPAAAGIRTSSV